MNGREGELRLCRKVGNEKEEVILDTAAMKKAESTSAETIDEQIDKIVQVPNLDVTLSEENTRKSTIEFK